MAQRALERGFKVPEYDDEGQLVEDTELLEEKEDFDKQKHEIDMMTSILSDVSECFINGNFYDVEEEVVNTPLLSLLQDSKKLPECVVVIR
jgi:hypothetical protein